MVRQDILCRPVLLLDRFMLTNDYSLNDYICIDQSVMIEPLRNHTVVETTIILLVNKYLGSYISVGNIDNHHPNLKCIIHIIIIYL